MLGEEREKVKRNSKWLKLELQGVIKWIIKKTENLEGFFYN